MRESRPAAVSTDAVLFRVRLTPRSGRDLVDGWKKAADGSLHLKACVRAAPENGKANIALIDLLATFLAVPKSALSITSGARSRLKRVEVRGDRAELQARLKAAGGMP